MSHQEMGRGAGTLTRGAALVAEARLDLGAVDQRLRSQLSGATRGWVGAGGGAFQTMYATWSERLREILGSLEAFEASLRATERDFTVTDDAASERHAALQSRIG
jgi:uncharacterized protein YukE